MTTQAPAEESLSRLLFEEPCTVNVMIKSERFGLACGWLIRDGHTLTAENYQLARDFADYWEDHEVPQSLIRAKLTLARDFADYWEDHEVPKSLIRAKLTETLLLRKDFGTEEEDY